jgi:hypothetical protein
MKLTFSWENTAGRITPYCCSQVVNKDGVSLLACLLMDDGGTGYLNSVPWIDEGIAMTDAVMKGAVVAGDWDRETWGATLKPDEVKIYSLYQEDYTETVALPIFRRALLAWRDFILSAPDASTIIEVEI